MMITELEKAKQQYKVETAINDLSAASQRALFGAVPVAGSTLQEVVNANQVMQQRQLDRTLYQQVQRDCQDLETFSALTRRHGADQTFNDIALRLTDESIPVAMRMSYAATLSNVTAAHFQDTALGLVNLQNGMQQLSDQNRGHFQSMITATNQMSSRVERLHHQLENQDINFAEFSVEINQQVEQTNANITTALIQLGNISITQEALLDGQGGTHESLQRVNAITQQIMFDQIQQIDINDYQNCPNIINLHDECRQLMDPQDDNDDIDARNELLLQKKSQLRAAIADVHTQREDYQTLMQTTSSLTSGAANVALLFGKPELALQIDVIGQSIVSAVDTTLGLIGSSLTAAVNPIMGVMNLIGIATKLFGAFSRDDNGPSPTEMILKSIQQVAKQIEQLRHEMHEGFNQVFQTLSEHHQQLILKFAELGSQQALTHALMRETFTSMHLRFDSLEQLQLATLHRLQAMQDQNLMAEFRSNVSELENCMVSLRGHELDEHYLDRAVLLSRIGSIDAVNQQLASPMVLTDLGLNPEMYGHFSQYFAAMLQEQRGEQWNLGQVANPLLTIPATLLALSNALNQYPVPAPEDEDFAIKNSDIERLSELKATLNRHCALAIGLRDPSVLSPLLEEYELTAGRLKATMQAKINSLSTLKLAQLRNSMPAQLNSLYGNHQAAFNSTDFDFNTFTWFNIPTRRMSRRHQSKTWTCTANIVNNNVGDSEKAGYLATCKQARARIIQLASLRADNAYAQSTSSALPLVGLPQLNLHHGVGYVQPMSSGLPVLSAPDPIFSSNNRPEFMSALLTAQTLGQGVIDLRYQIVNQRFELLIGFKTIANGQVENLSIATLSLPYTPGIYSGAEAVWNFWHGGNLQTNVEGEYVRTLHSTVGYFKNHWNNYLAGRNHAALNSQIFAVCCVKPNRADGFGHLNGEYEYEDTEGYKHSTPTAQVAALTRMQGLVGNQLPAGIQLNVNDVALTTLCETVTAVSEILKSEITASLLEALIVDGHSALSQACAAFEKSQRNLYGVLSLSFHDDMLNSDSELSQWFMQNPCNLASVRQHCRTGLISSLLDQLGQFDASISNLKQLLQGLTAAYTHAETQAHVLNNSSMRLTLHCINTFLARYQPHAVANENRLDIMGENVALFHFASGMVQGMLNANLSEQQFADMLQPIQQQLQAGVVGMGVDAQNRFLQRLQRHFRGADILIEWHDDGRAHPLRIAPAPHAPPVAPGAGRHGLFGQQAGQPDAADPAPEYADHFANQGL